MHRKQRLNAIVAAVAARGSPDAAELAVEFGVSPATARGGSRRGRRCSPPERARRVVVLADASKVGRVALAQVCRMAEVEVLVTDAGLAPEEGEKIQ